MVRAVACKATNGPEFNWSYYLLGHTSVGIIDPDTILQVMLANHMDWPSFNSFLGFMPLSTSPCYNQNWVLVEYKRMGKKSSI